MPLNTTWWVKQKQPSRVTAEFNPLTSVAVKIHSEFNSLWLCDIIWFHAENLANIGSDNNLLPDGTKPLSELMLTYH